MTVRPLAFVLCSLSLAAATALAQPPAAEPAQPKTPKPATAPSGQPSAPAPVPRESRRLGQPMNVKIEVTIMDQRESVQTLKKTVTVVTGDAMTGFIRSTANYIGIGLVPLNVDTEPEILPDGKIRLRLNLQYSLPGPAAATGTEAKDAGPHALATEIRENLSLILENGRPLIAAQSADPVGDRQVTIEVKATVLR